MKDFKNNVCYIVKLRNDFKYRKGDNMEEIAIFRSYLRKLMRDLKDIKKALSEKDMEKAETLIEDLIEDTQKDIED